MSEKKDYSVSEFKAKALGLLNEVARTRRPITITKRGMPIAKVIPCDTVSTKPIPGRLEGTILEERDIVSPLGAAIWHSSR